MSVELWTEKYRPKTFDEYVWRDSAMRKKCEEFVRERATPHLLLEGVAGTGKTSLAYLLLDQIGIPKGDILYINATRERKIEDIQAKIIGFVGTWALGETGIKYIILDEADAMSPLAQRLLRGEMETYHRECRFILTCNYAAKIIPAVHSRCQTFTFKTLDHNAFIDRLVDVLSKENIELHEEDNAANLLKIVDMTFPDLRKAINLAQQCSFVEIYATPVGLCGVNSINVEAGTEASHERTMRKIMAPNTEEKGTKDYLLEMASQFKAGRTVDARKLVVSQAQVEDYPEIYRFLYQNLEFWGDTEDKQDNALLAIRKALVNHSIAADPEINLAACMVELKMISNGTL